MKLFRAAAAVGIAKKVYDEARKPQNQARIKAAADKLRERRSGGSGRSGGSQPRQG